MILYTLIGTHIGKQFEIMRNTREEDRKLSDNRNNELEKHMTKVKDENENRNLNLIEITKKHEQLEALTKDIMSKINIFENGDTKHLSEKQIILKAAFKELETFNENQKAINVESKQRYHAIKADILAMKNTFIAKDKIESMIEKANCYNKLEGDKVIDQVFNQTKKLSEESAQSEEKIKKMSEKVEIIDKLIMDTKSCTEKQAKLRSALKDIEAFNEQQKWINESTQQKGQSFEDEMKILRGTLVEKEIVNEMIHEATKSNKKEDSELLQSAFSQINEVVGKLTIIDKITVDIKQLTEKQIKLKAAFKEVQDFAETQKSINAESVCYKICGCICTQTYKTLAKRHIVCLFRLMRM